MIVLRLIFPFIGSDGALINTDAVKHCDVLLLCDCSCMRRDGSILPHHRSSFTHRSFGTTLRGTAHCREGELPHNSPPLFFFSANDTAYIVDTTELLR